MMTVFPTLVPSFAQRNARGRSRSVSRVRLAAPQMSGRLVGRGRAGVDDCGGGAVSGTLAPVQAQFLAARPKPGFHSLSLRLHPTKHFSESVRCCSGPPRMQARQILSSLSGPLSPRESGASAGSASPGVRAEATAWPWLAYLSHPLGGPTGGGSA